jgi:hypothetical protein
MGTGNDNNTWGENCNNDVFAILEDAIAGQLSTSVTGGTTDLSTSPPPNGPSAARYGTLIFNGTLSSDQTVKVPNISKRWIVFNNTSGAHDFYMKTPVGPSILIPQGMHCEVWCDGLDTLRRLAARTGEIFSWGGTSVPAGAVECDGTAISRTGKGLELFGKIGTTWGVGDSVTTFNIPTLNTNGYFLRSRTGSVVVGTRLDDGIRAHTHDGDVSVSSSGSVSGSTGSTAVDHTHNFSWSGNGTTDGESNSHTHDINFIRSGNTPSGGVGSGANNNTITNGSTTSGAQSADHTHTFSYSGSSTTGATVASTAHTHTFSGSVTLSGSGTITTDSNNDAATETRPYCAAVLMCIWL